jgi:aspartyl-tRNA(Asn)/glutamyl-tRNA(Gln) amidotransferase subunit C
MSEISSTTIQHLSHLARLALTSEEQARFAQQLSPVIAYVEQLGSVDTASIGQLTGVTGLCNVLADDTPRALGDPCLVDPGALIAGAPLSQSGYVVVRAVMGEEVTGA